MLTVFNPFSLSMIRLIELSSVWVPEWNSNTFSNEIFSLLFVRNWVNQDFLFFLFSSLYKVADDQIYDSSILSSRKCFFSPSHISSQKDIILSSFFWIATIVNGSTFDSSLPSKYSLNPASEEVSSSSIFPRLSVWKLCFLCDLIIIRLHCIHYQL